MKAAKDRVVVEVEPRSDFGKNASRRLRVSGMVPGNVYGLDGEPIAVAVNPKRIEELLRSETGRNTIVSLSMEGSAQGREVMLRELQRHPVSERLIHVEFLRVDLTKKIQVRVPVRLVGIPTGVKLEGGIVDFMHREAEVACLPGAIPEHLDVDVTELHVNQHVAVKDLTVADGVQILDDPETIIAVVAVSKAEVATEGAAAATEEAAEPEVAAKGKESGAGEEGAGGD